MVGAGVGLTLSSVLLPAAVDAYGWRIALLLGGAALPFGLLLRRALPETLHLADTAPQEPRLARAGAAALVRASVVGVICGGWLSDRIGRRPVMILPEVALAVMILPIFHWIVTTRSMVALVVGGAVLGLTGSLGAGAFFPAFAERLPRAIRGRSVAIIYAVSIAVFGGTTQLIVTWLIHLTGNAMAPTFCWLAGSLVALSAKMLILESAPMRLPQRAFPRL